MSRISRLSLLLISRGDGSGCSLCVAARHSLRWALRSHSLLTGQPTIPLQVVDIDNPTHSHYRQRYMEDVPVLLLRQEDTGQETELFRHRMDRGVLLKRLLRVLGASR